MLDDASRTTATPPHPSPPHPPVSHRTPLQSRSISATSDARTADRLPRTTLAIDPSPRRTCPPRPIDTSSVRNSCCRGALPPRPCVLRSNASNHVVNTHLSLPIFCGTSPCSMPLTPYPSSSPISRIRPARDPLPPPLLRHRPLRDRAAPRTFCTAACRSQDDKRTCCTLVLRRAVAIQLPAPETVRGVAPFPRTQARSRAVCRSVAALGH